MTSRDDDLLARLNALKPTSVSLDSTPKASVDVEVNEPQTVEDKLANRLKALRSGAKVPVSDNHVSRQSPNSARQTADALTAQVRDEIATESAPISDWQQHDDGEQSLEELLAELDAHDDLRPDPNDSKQIASLIKEAREALPPRDESDLGEGDAAERDHDWVQVDPEEVTGPDEHEAKTDDQQDEDAADEYVTRVLAEVEMDSKYGAQGESEGDGDETNVGKDQELTGLNLPSTPSTLPPPPNMSAAESPNHEDVELESRFAKLGLESPSTPSAPPTAKPRVMASTPSAKPKSKIPTYTDDDIESWCCICNEDGEVRCLGCDGDIYCQQCWREGHGNGSGQERGHRAVQFVRKGAGGLAAV